MTQLSRRIPRTHRRAAIYKRVSKDLRGTSRSVEEQEEECRAVVRAHDDWELTDAAGADGMPGVWSDNDRSASKYATKARPDWELLMTAIAAGEIDVLVVWEPSRATRDRQVWAALAAACEQHEVLIAANGQVYDITDPDQAFQLDLFFSLGVRESGVTRKRILRTVRAQSVRGMPHGKIPYGYRREYDPEKGTLLRQVVREDQAEVIREAARRALHGEALLSITTDFNRRGVPAPRGEYWISGPLKEMLINPRYIAQRVHRGEVVGPAKWPRILDVETHHALVGLLCDPSRKQQRDSRIKHLLSGIAICDVCDGEMGPIGGSGYPAYICVGKTRNKITGEGTAGHVSRRITRLDADVSDAVIGRLSQPDLHEALESQDETADERVRQASEELAEMRAQLRDARIAAGRREISIASLAALESALTPDIEAAERRMRTMRMPSVVVDLVHPDADHVVEEWGKLPLLTKRLVIKALTNQIRVKLVGRGRKKYTPAESMSIEWA